MRLQIPDVPKSPNLRRGEHWSRTGKYAEYWKALVRSQIDNSHKPMKAKCNVTIVQMRKRKLDRDNLFASCKPILDALTHWKLIKDDSEEWIFFECKQVVGSGKITVINIEAI